VASKYAELLRLPGLALTWVTYPNFSRRAASIASEGSVAPAVPGSRAAARREERPFPSLGRLLAFGVVAGVLLAASAFVVLPAVYGEQFSSAVLPAAVISLGLVAEPAAGVASGFLLGSGRPGLNSLVLGGGFAVTLVLDLLLIPRHGSLGAAWASAVAYLTTDVLLIRAWRRLSQEQS
jgi:O-antigen/teichoic acid export membrane protein